ncbi:hypothetical protein FB446DRAFT_712885, partial [Lentinula raphanica]
MFLPFQVSMPRHFLVVNMFILSIITAVTAPPLNHGASGRAIVPHTRQPKSKQDTDDMPPRKKKLRVDQQRQENSYVSSSGVTGGTLTGSSKKEEEERKYETDYVALQDYEFTLIRRREQNGVRKLLVPVSSSEGVDHANEFWMIGWRLATSPSQQDAVYRTELLASSDSESKWEQNKLGYVRYTKPPVVLGTAKMPKWLRTKAISQVAEQVLEHHINKLPNAISLYQYQTLVRSVLTKFTKPPESLQAPGFQFTCYLSEHVGLFKQMVEKGGTAAGFELGNDMLWERELYRNVTEGKFEDVINEMLENKNEQVLKDKEFWDKHPLAPQNQDSSRSVWEDVLPNLPYLVGHRD